MMARQVRSQWLGKPSDQFEKDLAALVDTAATSEVEALVQANLGDLSLLKYRAEIAYAVQAAQQLQPDAKDSQILKAEYGQALGSFEELINRLSQYNPTAANSQRGNTPPPEHHWRSQVQAQLGQFWDDVTAARALREALGEDPLGGAVESADAILGQLQQQKEEADAALAALREAAAVTGATRFSQLYLDRSIKFATEAQRWLIAAIVLAVVAAIVLGAYVFTDPPDADAGAIAQFTLSRILALALPTTGLLFSLRGYSAGRHNALIFETKGFALQTFESFAEGASDDPATRHAVLIEAARSIFGHQSTGHLKNESPESPGSSLLLEVLRTGGSKSP